MGDPVVTREHAADGTRSMRTRCGLVDGQDGERLHVLRHLFSPGGRLACPTCCLALDQA